MFKKKKKKEEEFVKDEPKIPEPEQVLYEKNIELEPPIVPSEIQETPIEEPPPQVQEEDSNDEVIKLQQRIEQIKELQKQQKEKQIQEKIVVVKEIPMAPVREYVDESGSKIKLVTIEEYLTEQANK